MEQISRIGMDTSKHVFQLHGVNAAEVPVLRKKLRRKEMVTFFQKLAPTVIAIEACGASHHLARLLQSFGHTVKLIAPAAGQAVRQAQQERCGGRGSSVRGDEPADDALRTGEDS
jgi:transposase